MDVLFKAEVSWKIYAREGWGGLPDAMNLEIAGS